MSENAPADTDALINGMIARWRMDGAGVRPWVSPDKIAAFEAEHHVKLPADFSAYLQRANGMVGVDWDEWYNRFYPLEEFEPGLDHYPNLAGYYFFMNHSIWVLGYAINLNPTDPRYGQVIISHTHEPPAAESFTAFMQQYVDDPQSIIR
jgi:hypothetical protein